MARIDIPFTNEHFVAFLCAFLGMPYWYGTVVYKCTESRLQSKAKQYPAHYASSRMSKYRDAIKKQLICADCVGLVKGYMWTNGGKGVIEAIGTGKSFGNSYASHGCPDKSANGMFEWAKSKGMEYGTMKTMPDLPGIALRFNGHIGYYIGNGYAIEERGFAYGCVKTKVSDRPWTHWYKLPFIDYKAEEKRDKTTYSLGDRALKAGMKGTDVSVLQSVLHKLGYYDGAIDGDYNIDTAAAVKEFKEQHGIKASSGNVTATYGTRAHEALMEELAEYERGDDPESEPVKRTVRVTAKGTWNVRKGAGTQFAIMTVVKQGDEFEYVAEASNGWLGVIVGEGQGWISPKCAEVMK